MRWSLRSARWVQPHLKWDTHTARAVGAVGVWCSWSSGPLQRHRQCSLSNAAPLELIDPETPGPAWRSWAPDSLSTWGSWWEPSRCTCFCGKCALRKVYFRNGGLPSTNCGSNWRKTRRFGRRTDRPSSTWSTLITQVCPILSQRVDPSSFAGTFLFMFVVSETLISPWAFIWRADHSKQTVAESPACTNKPTMSQTVSAHLWEMRWYLPLCCRWRWPRGRRAVQKGAYSLLGDDRPQQPGDQGTARQKHVDAPL